MELTHIEINELRLSPKTKVFYVRRLIEQQAADAEKKRLADWDSAQLQDLIHDQVKREVRATEESEAIIFDHGLTHSMALAINADWLTSTGTSTSADTMMVDDSTSTTG